MATLTSSSSSSRNSEVCMSKCVVCSLRFKVPLEFQTHRHSQKHLARVFERIFNVFCNYLNLNKLLTKSGNRYRWNFEEETLPFCSECKQTVAKLVLLHDQLEGIQSKINKVVADISLTIMESQNENNNNSNNARHNSNSNSSQEEDVPDDKENNCVKDSEYNFRKVTRMRKAVRRFLNPAVILNDISSVGSPTTDPSTPSTIVDSDDNDAMNALITRPIPHGSKNSRHPDNNIVQDSNSNSNSAVACGSVNKNKNTNIPSTSSSSSSQQNTTISLLNTNKKEEPDNEKIMSSCQVVSESMDQSLIQSGNIVRNPLAISFKSGSGDKDKPLANQDRPSIICKTVSNPTSASSSATGNEQPIVIDNQNKNIIKEQVQSDLNEAGAEKKEEDEDKKEEGAVVEERIRYFYINTWPIEKLAGGKYMCTSCKVDTANRLEIGEHVKSEHPGRKKYQYKCPMKDCDRDFVVLRSFLYHLEIVHCDVYPDGIFPTVISCGPGRFLYDLQWFYVETEDEKFQCQKCGFVAENEKPGDTEAIVKHILMHKALDSTECDVCGKIFRRKEGLRMHKALLHTEQEPEQQSSSSSSTSSPSTSKAAQPPLQSSSSTNTNVNTATSKTTTTSTPAPLRIKPIKLPPSATKTTSSKPSPTSSSSSLAIVPAPKLTTAIKNKPSGPASSKASTSSTLSTSTPVSSASSSSIPSTSAPVKSSSDQGNVQKIGPNQFIYLDKFAFELLPNGGGYKCLTCSIIKKGFQINMVKHIKTHASTSAAATTSTSTTSSSSGSGVKTTSDKEKKSVEGPAAKKKRLSNS